MRRLAVVFLCGVACAPAWSANPLGVYVGAGAGQSDLAQDGFPSGASNPTSFSEHASAWKALAGLRPLPWLGAEIEYVDLGPRSANLCCAVTATSFLVPAAAKANGPALFGLAFLPLAPFALYGKAGVSRVRTTGDSAAVGIVGVDICYFYPANLGCRALHDDRYTTGLAWGGGVELKVSAIALRAEYERFGSGDARPSLASFVVTWSF